MSYKSIIYISLGIVLIVIAVFVLYRFVGNTLQNNDTASQPQTQKTALTQTSEGAVTVEVTPMTLTPGSQVLFEIQFNTHSVDLNYDIAKTAQLTDDKGNLYKPVSWTGGKGGHHIEGVLTFPTMAKSAKKVTLTIPDIDSQNRVFTWSL